MLHCIADFITYVITPSVFMGQRNGFQRFVTFLRSVHNYILSCKYMHMPTHYNQYNHYSISHCGVQKKVLNSMCELFPTLNALEKLE